MINSLFLSKLDFIIALGHTIHNLCHDVSHITTIFDISTDQDFEVQQPVQSRRQPGKIADYDPMQNQQSPAPVPSYGGPASAPPVPKDSTPYSSRGQARVVYSTSDNNPGMYINIRTQYSGIRCTVSISI